MSIHPEPEYVARLAKRYSHYRRQLTLQAFCVYASIATVAPSWVDIALVPAFELFAFLRVHQYAEDLILWLVH